MIDNLVNFFVDSFLFQVLHIIFPKNTEATKRCYPWGIHFNVQNFNFFQNIVCRCPLKFSFGLSNLFKFMIDWGWLLIFILILIEGRIRSSCVDNVVDKAREGILFPFSNFIIDKYLGSIDFVPENFQIFLRILFVWFGEF